MAPDRGSRPESASHLGGELLMHPPGRSFTLRGLCVGLLVGLVICFSNMYFGLQTGWVSPMTLPASLLGFGVFRTLSKHLDFPFTPVENVLVQTVAGSMALMPLGCGFVGVLPAMNYLLSPDEMGPIQMSTWKLIIWSLGLCYFGVVFAVPLRRQVIIRERLRFPSGFSTAVLIGVLHGQTPDPSETSKDHASSGAFASLVPRVSQHSTSDRIGDDSESALDDDEAKVVRPWGTNIRLLLVCFIISGVFTLAMHFYPVLRNLPIFGRVAAESWLWTFNPSLAYVGQGVIMGPETTLHMALGAFVGWAILSPLAHYREWAPGPVGDWDSGSKGWIVWVSLSIMLSDAIINLAHVGSQMLLGPAVFEPLKSRFKWLVGKGSIQTEYTQLRNTDDENTLLVPESTQQGLYQSGSGNIWDHHTHPRLGMLDEDAPPEQQVSNRTISVGLAVSILLCIVSIHVVFRDLVPLYATVLAVAMALVLSVMGVRALGETDLNPVSGISKLAQLFFALVVPASNKAAILINLISGAVSEAGALQAGELMQDLKTGHLLGAAPNAQFWGQVIGATVGAIVSAFIYQLYTTVYPIPGDLFQVPTAYVWIFTARLVTGKGLPPMAKEWAIGAGVLFSATTIARITSTGKRWRALIPGGVAVAVGMYNVPSFTLARAVGGLFGWYWQAILKKSSTPLIVIASGFILGEGFLSIVNLILESLRTPRS